MVNEESLLVGTLTESLEDYLEIIYRLLQHSKVARVRDIAREKDVKTSSVTSALQRLAKEGLVEYQAREYVDLTEVGREFAFRLNQRHNFLKRFLVELLDVDEKTAEVDACSMEHSISVTTLDRFSALAEFLTYCPNVDPELMAHFRECWVKERNEADVCNGESKRGIWVQRERLSSEMGIHALKDMTPGDSGHITRIIGSHSLRTELIQRGFLPPARITLRNSLPDGSYETTISEEKVILSSEEADAIFVWVSRVDEERNLETPVIKSSKSLADLMPGQVFRVSNISTVGEIRQRLTDMGFIRGAKGKVLREGLLKDPIEVEIGGSLLSLRRSEASDIVVEVM